MLTVLNSILSLHCSSSFSLWCYPGPNVPGLGGKRNPVASHVIWRHGTSWRANLLETEDVMLQVGKLLQLVCVSLFLFFFFFIWRVFLKETAKRESVQTSRFKRISRFWRIWTHSCKNCNQLSHRNINTEWLLVFWWLFSTCKTQNTEHYWWTVVARASGGWPAFHLTNLERWLNNWERLLTIISAGELCAHGRRWSPERCLENKWLRHQGSICTHCSFVDWRFKVGFSTRANLLKMGS